MPWLWPKPVFLKDPLGSLAKSNRRVTRLLFQPESPKIRQARQEVQAHQSIRRLILGREFSRESEFPQEWELEQVPEMAQVLQQASGLEWCLLQVWRV